MKCIKTNFEQLEKISDCHISAFPDSLYSKLGNSFLKNMFLWYIVSERGILFHIEKDDQIIGYCCGTINTSPGLPSALTNVIQFRFGLFLWSFIRKPWLIFHKNNLKQIPVLLQNIMLKIGRRNANSLSNNISNESFIPTMGIVSIGIHKDYQIKGFGSILLKEFEQQALRNGIHMITLSVRLDNSQAIASYKKNGWLIKSLNTDSMKMFKEI